MKATRIILAAAAAALMASPVLANDAAKTAPAAIASSGMSKWAEIDTDKDGFISKDEWAAEGQKMFDAKDTDHDGKLSKDEYFGKYAKAKHMAKTESTSTPAATNEKAPAPADAAPAAGADGTGGATAQ